MPISFQPPLLSTLIALALAIVAVNPALGQSSVWIDLTPMTRSVLGAETELQTDFSLGWSTEDGWRMLGGFSAKSQENDNFGTTVKTSLYDVDFRAGRRWATGILATENERWFAHWGVDLIFGLDHIDTSTDGSSFIATNRTNDYRAGAGGVVTVGYQLSRHFNFALEGRLDALYTYEKTVIGDNFSPPNISVDEGWAVRLTPPVQLFLCYQFSAK